MRRFQILIFTILLSKFDCLGQNYNPSNKTDTLNLKQLAFRKVIAYKINSVTILVDYNDFMKSFKPFWKKYRNEVRSLNRGKENAVEENPYYVKRFIFLDSTYKQLIRQVVAADTAYITQLSFEIADIGTSYNFIKKIEQGNCIILDNQNVRHFKILKQKYSYQKAPLDGWGGRLYFIAGQEKPFISGTDWVS
jgi:hypothetical protein